MADLNENKLITLGNLKKYTEKIKELISNNSYQEITYSNLKNLRDNSLLTPGTWYRITDYETTVFNNDNARAAGHPFDVVVLATDVNQLSEDAKAVHSARDTEGYFALSNLAAWKLKYSLDNDTTKFAWAGTGGKGIIWEMEDENNNLCPYDFKNIQFMRYPIIVDNEIMPTSLDEIQGDLAGSIGGGLSSYDFYGKYVGLDSFGTMLPQSHYIPRNASIHINEGKYLYTFSVIDANGDVYDKSMGVDLSSAGMGIMNVCKSNKIAPMYDGDTFNPMLNDNVFVTNLYDIENDLYKLVTFNNKLDECSCKNTFTDACIFNEIGMDYSNNTSGDEFIYNIFDMRIHNNMFGCGFSLNTIGEQFIDSLIGNYISCNTFGKGCSNIFMSHDCENNSIGDRCYLLDCVTFYGNTIGKDCINNRFWNACFNNTIGDNCCNNEFNSGMRDSTIFNNVCYIATISDAQNIQILNGTCGSEENHIFIEVEKNADYTQIVRLGQDGKPYITPMLDCTQSDIESIF